MDKGLRLSRCAIAAVCSQPVRYARSKPWIPKFKIMRTIQPFKPPPNLRELYMKLAKMPKAEAVEQMKKKGYLPPQNFIDRTLYFSTTSEIFEPYVPPANEGKSSIISNVPGLQTVADKTKSYRAERLIRKYDSNFDASEFANEAFDVYKKSMELLQDFPENSLELLDIVTDKAFIMLTDGLENQKFRWKFHASIEPPRSVHTRVTHLLQEHNKFAQVTVRFHTKQTIAIYDRFGRLAFGSPTLEKDVLEYVVFEKHLADEYGAWRMHMKILPEGSIPSNFSRRTMMLPSSEHLKGDSEIVDSE